MGKNSGYSGGEGATLKTKIIKYLVVIILQCFNGVQTIQLYNIVVIILQCFNAVQTIQLYKKIMVSFTINSTMGRVYEPELFCLFAC